MRTTLTNKKIKVYFFAFFLGSGTTIAFALDKLTLPLNDKSYVSVKRDKTGILAQTSSNKIVEIEGSLLTTFKQADELSLVIPLSINRKDNAPLNLFYLCALHPMQRIETVTVVQVTRTCFT